MNRYPSSRSSDDAIFGSQLYSKPHLPRLSKTLSLQRIVVHFRHQGAGQACCDFACAVEFQTIGEVQVDTALGFFTLVLSRQGPVHDIAIAVAGDEFLNVGWISIDQSFRRKLDHVGLGTLQ